LPTTTENGNTVQGSYTRTTSGQDGYNISETGQNSGGSFTETVGGGDNYTLTESGNSADQTFTRTITGGGSYTRQDSGAGATLASGSGSISYTENESADARSGNLSQTETGSERYSLLEKFNNAANTGGGNTPGNMNFLPFGQPFVDPDPAQHPRIVNANPLAAQVAAGADPATVIPDNTVIVIGGQQYQHQPGRTISGQMGATATEASSGLPHGQIRVTTAGEIRAAGGTVTLAPEEAGPGGPVNTWHVNVTEGPQSAFPEQTVGNVPTSQRLRQPTRPQGAARTPGGAASGSAEPAAPTSRASTAPVEPPQLRNPRGIRAPSTRPGGALSSVGIGIGLTGLDAVLTLLIAAATEDARRQAAVRLSQEYGRVLGTVNSIQSQIESGTIRRDQIEPLIGRLHLLTLDIQRAIAGIRQGASSTQQSISASAMCGQGGAIPPSLYGPPVLDRTEQLQIGQLNTILRAIRAAMTALRDRL
jgi:hypothetical protein